MCSWCVFNGEGFGFGGFDPGCLVGHGCTGISRSLRLKILGMIMSIRTDRTYEKSFEMRRVSGICKPLAPYLENKM
jgi:hypothetical protein